MLDIVEFRGTLHVVDPVVGDVGVCGRHVPGGDVVARDVSPLWAYRFIGSEDFGTDVDGSPRSGHAVTHCVDCVVALAEISGGEDL